MGECRHKNLHGWTRHQLNSVATVVIVIVGMAVLSMLLLRGRMVCGARGLNGVLSLNSKPLSRIAVDQRLPAEGVSPTRNDA